MPIDKTITLEGTLTLQELKNILIDQLVKGGHMTLRDRVEITLTDTKTETGRLHYNNFDSDPIFSFSGVKFTAKITERPPGGFANDIDEDDLRNGRKIS